MSSVVVIMNKEGLAIAADSAHQISNSENDLKTTPTANKIYNLCVDPASPISIALCDNLDFNGIPFDILVTDFRKKNPGPWETLDSCKMSFLNYLKGNPIGDPDYDDYFIKTDYTACFTAFLDIFRSNGCLNAKRQVEQFEDAVSKDPIWDLITEDDLNGAVFFPLLNMLDEYLNEKIYTPLLPFKERIHKALLRALQNKYRYEPDKAPITTGLSVIICGFGIKEYYPSMQHVYLVGTLPNKMLYLDIHKETPSYDEPTCLYPAGKGKEIIESIIFGMSENAKAAICNTNSLDAIDIASNFEDKRNQALNALSIYPPVELAKAAKMLVDVTGFRQRLLLEIETIGGPVDVGVITKESGFRWYARKHYYDPAINPQCLSSHS